MAMEAAIALVRANDICRSDRNRRVTARTIAGDHVCPAGLGEGANRVCPAGLGKGRIPARLLASEVLGMQHWIIVLPNDGWQPLGWTPACLVHSPHGGICEHDQCVGLYGDAITVLAQLNCARTVLPIPPNVDLNSINTPSSCSSNCLHS